MDDVKFFYHGNGRFEELYFNPDAESGAQFVSVIFYSSDFMKAIKNSNGDSKSVFSYLDLHSKCCLYDIGDDEYYDAEREFYSEDNKCISIGENEETMNAILSYSFLEN